MNRNVEMKARVADSCRMRSTLEDLSDTPCQELRQEDTFFGTRNGRLKLRVSPEGGAELVYYERSDVRGAKESRYVRYSTSDPTNLRCMLSAALGVEGVVRKWRSLYRVGQTRLHLDAVEDLGTFLELEVMLTPEQTSEDGQRIANELAGRLQIRHDELVPCAYIDLLPKGGPDAATA